MSERPDPYRCPCPFPHDGETHVWVERRGATYCVIAAGTVAAEFDSEPDAELHADILYNLYNRP